MKISRKNSANVSDDAATRKLEESRDALRQAIFQKTANEALKIPNGYLKVAVKIIRWNENIDDFKGHTQEIARLERIFRDRFGYQCSVHSIDDNKKPQLDINKAILDHVFEHDDPHSLLIFYYTGHGAEDDEKLLELSASEIIRVTGRHEATASWPKAEIPILKEMQGDALVVLDCCMASLAAKGRNLGTRTYQLLAAVSEDMETFGPGPKSFTTAFCNSLEELLDERDGRPFLMTQLVEKINKQRKRQACLMWDRLSSYKRTLQLVPLHQHQTQEREAAFQTSDLEKASLGLRFSLKEHDLSDELVQKFAEHLPRVCHDIGLPLRRIYWEGMATGKPAMKRIIEPLNDEDYDYPGHSVRDATIRTFFGAATHLNTRVRMLKALKKRRESRLLSPEETGGSLVLFAKTMMLVSIGLAGAFLFTERKERYILFGTAGIVALACKA
ncbi:uncharacterized protein J4E92_005695 [Alternaria infectoria]|uniref:uncharacterized protein n=1 Tax=Alternaria infectoria TaxID=45303 RepID=UPI00221ECAFD|nr:uncharacterized protein J4E92_005695 [Alternaria infectoria]KAI4928211.1 hypothetical protein J4E92_005695 [Alternaria infectoria]